jgi:hypothetical protein
MTKKNRIYLWVGKEPGVLDGQIVNCSSEHDPSNSWRIGRYRGLCGGFFYTNNRQTKELTHNGCSTKENAAAASAGPNKTFLPECPSCMIQACQQLAKTVDNARLINHALKTSSTPRNTRH